MKGKSCLTNLIEFFEDVTSRVDKGEPVDVIFGLSEGFRQGPT